MLSGLALLQTSLRHGTQWSDEFDKQDAGFQNKGWLLKWFEKGCKEETGREGLHKRPRLAQDICTSQLATMLYKTAYPPLGTCTRIYYEWCCSQMNQPAYPPLATILYLVLCWHAVLGMMINLNLNKLEHAWYLVRPSQVRPHLVLSTIKQYLNAPEGPFCTRYHAMPCYRVDPLIQYKMHRQDHPVLGTLLYFNVCANQTMLYCGKIVK